ncbi:MAG TPA: hypothetical protein VIK78_15750 [Ruminiclostridium sp.]
MKSSPKKSVHKEAKHTEKIPMENNSKKSIHKINFEQYIGQTVTVYVNAGGLVGNGFTGVLMGRSDTFIKLLVIPQGPPACSLGNACNSSNTGNVLFCLFCPFNKNVTLGTIAEISIMSIVAFVHNISSLQ